MTKKRFTSQRTDDYNYSDILDNGKWIGICHVDCEDDFVDKLNELSEKNKQLKKQLDEAIDGLHKQITTSENTFEGLMKENKELRQKQQEMRVLLTKIEREFRERGILTEEEFMRLLE